MKRIYLICAVFFWSLTVLTNASAAEDDVYPGTFVGIDNADGIGLWLEPTRTKGELRGRILFPNRTLFKFTGVIRDGAVNGIARSPAGEGVLRITPAAVGILVEWVPLTRGAFKKEPLAANPVALALVREGTFLPDLPPGYRKPPDKNARWISTLGFVDSYQFWPADAVGRGLRLLPTNHLAMMRLFGHFQTDVLWKVCQSTVYSKNLHFVLKEQGVKCRQVIDGIAHIQKTGKFETYRRIVAEEKALLRDVVGCSQGMRVQRSCIAISEKMSEWALKFETSNRVLKSYGA